MSPQRKHMARDFARQFYDSDGWRKCRLGYISHRRSIDGGLCEKCREQPGKIIHHKIHLTPDNITDPDIALGFDNLMYVCIECHNIIHGYAPELPERAVRYAFDLDGNPIPVPNKPLSPH